MKIIKGTKSVRNILRPIFLLLKKCKDNYIKIGLLKSKIVMMINNLINLKLLKVITKILVVLFLLIIKMNKLKLNKKTKYILNYLKITIS